MSAICCGGSATSSAKVVLAGMQTQAIVFSATAQIIVNPWRAACWLTMHVERQVVGSMHKSRCVPCSSVGSAVNRKVVGSNPTMGVFFCQACNLLLESVVLQLWCSRMLSPQDHTNVGNRTFGRSRRVFGFALQTLCVVHIAAILCGSTIAD